MRKPNLSPLQQSEWNSLTKAQRDVITIFIDNYYEVNAVEEENGFYEVLDINDVDAATYTTTEQYIVWRSVTLHQKLVVKEAYRQMLDLNGADLILKYDEDEVYNFPMPFDVFVLYNTFSTMNNITFTFLTNIK
jgi:hypothetical protein